MPKRGEKKGDVRKRGEKERERKGELEKLDQGPASGKAGRLCWHFPVRFLSLSS